MFFLGRIIDGLTAGKINTLFAYIADSTEPKECTKWLSYIGAAMGIGCTVGPALGSPLGAISISLLFFVTAGIMFLSIICTYIFLPESLSPAKRLTHFSVKNFNILGQFKDIFTMKEARALIIIGGFFYVGLGIYQFNFTWKWVNMKNCYLRTVFKQTSITASSRKQLFHKLKERYKGPFSI